MTGFSKLAALASAALAGAAPAAATITVPFTFVGATTAPGTVSGSLTFAAAGTGVQATGLYIDSATNFVSG